MSDGPFEFLSPEWIAAMHQLRAEHATGSNDVAVEVRVNMLVTDAPFDEPYIRGYVDTSTGTVLIEEGHLDDPELSLEIPYDVAKSMFVGADPQAAMTAIMGGRIKALGDVTRLLALPLPAPDAEPSANVASIFRRIRELTI